MNRILKSRKLIIGGMLNIIVALCAIYYANSKVEQAAFGKTFSNVNDVPYVKTALLLGTSQYLANGNTNQYFSNRITAAVMLFRAGKIKYVVISGDNSRVGYDEPSDMKNELIRNGIDSTRIYLDYAGFRTYDSMIRFQKIFGQDTAIVISQKFHNERAIYIADKIHLTAYGYNAADVDKYFGFKTNVREKFARVKMLLDFLIGVEPKFLGNQVVIDR